jgi:hypothetical protein
MIIVRDKPSLTNTMGVLTIEETGFTCFTLEDVARAPGFKIKGESAIPEGKYKCRVTQSPRFGRPLPLIYNTNIYTVSDGRGVIFSGIRIHNGVNHNHTDGCILVGFKRNSKGIWEPAADKLTQELVDLYGLNTEFDFEIINKQTA